MSVDAEAVRRMLEVDKAKGRSNVEAAGIALWLNEQRPRQELLSHETRREAEEVARDAGVDAVGEPGFRRSSARRGAARPLPRRAHPISLRAA